MKIVKTLSSLIGGTVIVAGMISVASPAHALLWTLNNFTLNDGSSVSGFFNYDSSTNTVGTVSETVNLSSAGQTLVGVSSFVFDGGTTTNGTVFNFTSTADSSSFFKFTAAQQLLNSIASGTPSGSNASVLATGGSLNTKVVIGGAQVGSVSSPNTIAAVVTAGTGSSGGTTGVPFEVPGGATIPVFGSILALGVMNKAKKSLKLNTCVNTSSN